MTSDMQLQRDIIDELTWRPNICEADSGVGVEGVERKALRSTQQLRAAADDTDLHMGLNDDSR